MPMIVQTLLGSAAEPAHLTTLEVSVRSLIVVGCAMVVVRVAAQRFRPEAAPFDVIVGVLLGSILSRTINGPSSMIPTIACAVLLVLVPWLAGRISWRGQRLADFLQGAPVPPFPNGRRDADASRRDNISEPDLDQVLRFWGRPADARLVTLERSGHISVARRR
jgi:uncharacterized membrane protein YcaP (DUF421 family)